jgi:penicillin-binding protein 1A
VIWEAFKAESEPRRTIHRDELIVVKQKVEKKQATVKTERRQSSGETSQPRDSDFLQREGGIY